MTPPETLMLLTADQVAPAQPGELVVRQSWPGMEAIALALLLAAAGLAAAPFLLADGAPPWYAVAFAWWIAFWLWVVGRLMRHMAMSARRGWVLRAGEDYLLVNLRSYLNSHFPAEDATVLLIPRRCIRWLRVVAQDGRETITDAHRIHERTVRRAFLDIALSADLAPVRAALNRERTQRGRAWIGSSRYNHVSVRLEGDNALRLIWRDSRNRLRPGLAEVAAALRSRFVFRGGAVEAEPPLAALRGDAIDDRILAAAERGDIIEAVKLAKMLYGLDTDQARRFVEDLRR